MVIIPDFISTTMVKYNQLFILNRILTPSLTSLNGQGPRTWAAMAPVAPSCIPRVLPGLKPYQPNHSAKVPSLTLRGGWKLMVGSLVVKLLVHGKLMVKLMVGELACLLLVDWSNCWWSIGLVNSFDWKWIVG